MTGRLVHRAIVPLLLAAGTTAAAASGVDSLALASAQAARTAFAPFQAEAIEILVAWGEKRNEAMELVELACKRHPDIKTAEALVPLVYRLKQGVEV